MSSIYFPFLSCQEYDAIEFGGYIEVNLAS
jgi:hypothetical protein